MSDVSGSGGSTSQAAPRRTGVRRWRWVGLGGLIVVVVAVVLAVTLSGGNGPAAAPTVGAVAPAGSFTTVSGQSEDVSSLRGHPVLVWLVTTWCPVCQAGTRAMTAHLMAGLAGDHVRVLELENHGNLGHANPTWTSFIHSYAGAGPYSPDWTFGVASSGLTQAYNPKGVMDIYYLVDSTGHVRYVNAGPAATGSTLLARASSLS